MDLWNTYKEKTVGNFAASKFLLSTGDRKHTSLNMVTEKASGLLINKAMSMGYDEAHRYIIARDIDVDMLFTAYDVNSRFVLAARITRDPGKAWNRIFSTLEKLKKPNLEFRFIGLQNGYKNSLHIIDTVHRRTQGKLVEVDLFGSDTRHIVIDTKIGVPYDLLVLNRIYRPGELACKLKLEEFKAMLGQLSFV